MELKQWQIFRFNQFDSRQGSDPIQPLDDNRPYRRFVIITPQRFLDKKLPKVTCVPIGEKAANIFLQIPLVKGESGCNKDCHIWADEIYTLESKWFDFNYGKLLDEKIILLKSAIADYLDI